MRVRLTFLAFFIATAARAQSIPRAPAADTVPHVRVAHYPHPSSSTWMSIGSTMVPMAAGLVVGDNSSGTAAALLFGGLVAGPAAGYWRGGIGAKAWPGLLIRTGGLFILAAGSGHCLSQMFDSGCSSGANAAVIGGAALLLGSAVYDIATVSHKVRANNGALARASVVPLFSPSERRVGVEVVVGF